MQQVILKKTITIIGKCSTRSAVITVTLNHSSKDRIMPRKGEENKPNVFHTVHAYIENVCRYESDDANDHHSLMNELEKCESFITKFLQTVADNLQLTPNTFEALQSKGFILHTPLYNYDLNS